MAVIGTVYWSNVNPLSDPGFARLPELFAAIQRTGWPPEGWVGGSAYHNEDGALPERAPGYYTKFDCGPPPAAGRDA